VMPKGKRYSFGFLEGDHSDKPAKANEVQRPLAQRGNTALQCLQNAPESFLIAGWRPAKIIAALI